MQYETASAKRKRMIADCFKEIIQKKSFSKITVSEIIDNCKINRKTFYYHFEDMYALLKWTLEQEAIEVVKKFNLPAEYEASIRFAMDYIEENNRMLNNICCSVGRDQLRRLFYADFIDVIHSAINKTEEKEHISAPAEYKIFLEKFYAEAIAGILVEWITDSLACNREKTIRYLSMILHSAIPNALCAAKPADTNSIKNEIRTFI